ncbi:MAG: hypothetical protein LBP63_11375 [Prevotellaceae bacterium]|jgi:hypothetical protein|nr:hypothetical protein [Prevotellaceae bacterium]
MIHIHAEIANAIKEIEELKWIDISPRLDSHTNAYPAAYIGVDEQTPLNPLGGMNGIASVAFSVEVWIKPYKSSTVKPLSPVIVDLENNFKLIEDIRQSITNYQSEFIAGTTLISETVEKQEDGFYRALQRWECLTQMWNTEITDAPGDAPKPEFI